MKTNAVHQAEFKASQKQKGKVRLGVDWVTPEEKLNIKAYLRGEAEIKLKGKE